MKREFVMRGKTASGGQVTLEFGAKTKENKNMAYRMTEFEIYPSTAITTTNQELVATVTAGKTFEDPANPNFNNDGLIGTALFTMQPLAPAGSNDFYARFNSVNDTFMITQNLILAVLDTRAGAPADVNWQCRFEAVKMSDSETAVTNYKQFAIFDE
jgi:hypothetical protein